MVTRIRIQLKNFPALRVTVTTTREQIMQALYTPYICVGYNITRVTKLQEPFCEDASTAGDVLPSQCLPADELQTVVRHMRFEPDATAFQVVVIEPNSAQQRRRRKGPLQVYWRRRLPHQILGSARHCSSSVAAH